MRPMCWRVRKALALAVAPVVAVSVGSPSRAASASKAMLSTGLLQVRSVHQNVAPGASNLTAYPLMSPPINGFVPQVVLGLTDEHDDDDFSLSAHASSFPAGNLPLNGSPHYETAIFDTGSSGHLITLAAYGAFNVAGSGREGENYATLAGAGEETEDTLISSALGVYITGLGNASVSGGSTISVAPNTMKGQYNTSILSTLYPPPPPNPNPNATYSVLPNIIGSPMVAQYQANIRNSQTHTLVINGEPTTSPQIDLGPLGTNTKVPGGYVRVDVELMSPPLPGYTTPPSFGPNFNNSEEFLQHPSRNATWPSNWAAMIANGVTGTDAGYGQGGGTFPGQQFLMDTGAQVTVLSESVAASVGFYKTMPELTPPEFTVEVGGVGGIQVVPGFYLDSLTLPTNGPALNWSHVPVIVLDLIDPRDGSGVIPGIIGTNLFTDRDIIINGGSSVPYFAFGPQFREWSNANGGNWSDVAKWSEAGVPNLVNVPALFRSAITAARTINVDGNYTVGGLTFDSSNSYTLGGSGRITVQTTSPTVTAVLTTPGSIWVGAGNHTISAPMTFASDVTIGLDTPASGLTISSDVTAGTQSITKLGPGTLQMKNVRASTFTINKGTTAILQNGGQSGTSKVKTLAIAAGAKLDVKDNDLVITNMTVGQAYGTAYDGVTGMVQKGRNGGTWNGSGIMTSMTAALSASYTSLGVATASDVLHIAATATTSWSGQTVAGGDILVMYTYGGDATLDGKLNIDDYVRIDFAIPIGLTGWSNGDFNYDGKVNIDDYVIIDGNIPIQGSSLLSASGESSGLSTVPEPAAGLATLGLAFSVLCRRRRA